MQEKTVENYFVRAAKRSGCLVYKFVSPGMSGVPDRIVITPRGETIYVELKSSTGRVRKLQEYQHRLLRRQGCRVELIRSREQVDQFILSVTGEDVIR